MLALVHSDETNGPERTGAAAIFNFIAPLGYHGESVLRQLPFSSGDDDLRARGQERAAALPENVLKAESHFLSNGPSRGQEQNGRAR